MFTRIAIRCGAPAALISLGTVLALAGCSSQDLPTSAVTGVSSSTSVASVSAGSGGESATPRQSAEGSAGAAGSGSGSADAPGCVLSSLSITTGSVLSPSGIGFSAEPITLTNTGSAACAVLGWPGVAALDSAGTQVYQAARAGTHGTAITLRPGQSASAVLYAVSSLGSRGGSSCTQVTGLLVTPPDETHSRRIALASPMCVAPELTALLPGTGGTVSAVAEYDEAQSLWKQGASAISADQGSYEIEAGDLLENAVEAGVPGTSGFMTSAAELGQLSSLPDAMLNATQQSEFDSDVADLDGFFGTPGLYH